MTRNESGRERTLHLNSSFLLQHGESTLEVIDSAPTATKLGQGLIRREDAQVLLLDTKGTTGRQRPLVANA